ncbi:hypothetical protein Ga0123462_1001 [Mariprofundus ferrinatatus]|uniref:Uncharacterized protein n=2 Tax=Mariprofundus ferrinatatus TaxID=1921087 RepID=A0A2K8L3F9_9PROT|nr:hypothetical protein Ga0123462_1001 [Mariprofundus ferrinatatus]
MSAAKQAIADSRFEKAEQILTEMLEFAPSETAGWKLLARVQRKLGHIEAGIASAERALQLQNANATMEPPVSATLARLLWKQGERNQAHEMLDILIARQPEDHALVMLKHAWNQESDS